MNIGGLNIIITGAASGFGKEMTIQFSQSGANVFAIDINQTGLEELKKTCQSINIYYCDITDNDLVENTIKSIFDKINRPTVLINNAGIMKNAPLINLLDKNEKKHNLDLWNKVVAINQTSVFLMTRSFAEQMLSKRLKGAIVNISSISSQGNIGQTAYSATKAAVESMTKVWAKELGRFGIRANAVAPGFMDTAGTHEALEEKMLSQWIEKTPLRRTGTINEVVGAVRFAIENDFITGEVINVNGGLTI